MITYAQRAKSINEIRLVMRNPIQAISLLKELKHGATPTFSFVGYTKYYLNFGKKDINPILSLSLFPQKSRKSRLSLVHLSVDECWKLGFIDDTKRNLIHCSVNAINKLIVKYKLIYYFL